MFKNIKMKKLTKRLGLTLLILMVSFNMSVSLNAQTPADDPGIGGPGVGAAPAGDGAPTVPFDNTMNLIFLGTIFLMASQSRKYKQVLVSNK